jgi:hypothetical protein
MDEELKKYLDGKFAAQDEQTGQMREKFAKLAEQANEKFAKQTEQMGEMAGGLRAEMHEMAAKLTEQMRDMQTELLRGFEAFSAGQTIRLRKVEADQSNLDTSLSGRVNIVEARLTQIELRLGRQ